MDWEEVKVGLEEAVKGFGGMRGLSGTVVLVKSLEGSDGGLKEDRLIWRLGVSPPPSRGWASISTWSFSLNEKKTVSSIVVWNFWLRKSRDFSLYILKTKT